MSPHLCIVDQYYRQYPYKDNETYVAHLIDTLIKSLANGAQASGVKNTQKLLL